MEIHKELLKLYLKLRLLTSQGKISAPNIGVKLIGYPSQTIELSIYGRIYRLEHTWDYDDDGNIEVTGFQIRYNNLCYILEEETSLPNDEQFVSDMNYLIEQYNNFHYETKH